MTSELPSDRTEGPAKARDAQARSEALFELSPSLWVSLDRHGTIDTVNTGGAATLGYDPVELAGAPLHHIVDEEDRPRLKELIDAAASSSERAFSCDLRVRRQDGTTLWTRASLRSMPPMEAGRRVLLVCSGVSERETTEKRLLEFRQRLRVLTSRLILAEEGERRRIATLLHDDVGHSLALAQIRLGKIEREATDDLRRDLGAVRELIAEAIGSTRSLTFELSSPVLYELGLEAALKSVVDRLAEATSIRFEVDSDGRGRALSQDRNVLLFRSVRELLLNAAKHAQARKVTLSLRTIKDQVQIRVTDDGVGFDVIRTISSGELQPGRGLLAATEQVQAVGGSLVVDSDPAKGTSCLIVAPLQDDPP